MYPVYTTLVYTPLYIPGYTMLPSYPVTCTSVQQRVPDDEALGSTLGIVRVNEAKRAFQPPKV